MTLPQVEIKLPKDLGDRTWGHELLVVQTKDYIGKVMYMQAGKAGGLQYHEQKDECSYLVSGQAWVYTDTGDGQLSKFLLNPGTAVYIPPGAVHKVQAITDCMFVEWSNPVFDDRVRVEERYGRTDTDGLQTTGGDYTHKEFGYVWDSDTGSVTPIQSQCVHTHARIRNDGKAFICEVCEKPL